MVRNWRAGITIAIASLVLAGCSPDSGNTGVKTPAEGPAPGDTTANRAPVISGTPSPTATVGTQWRFRPSASDPDGDPLTWSIRGKPSEATFSASTGELSWTPTSTGTWSNIVITVTDARGASASLPAFSVAVVPAAGSGSAQLSWRAPAAYTDGSPLPAGDVAAYRIYHGTSASNLNRIVEVDGNASTYTVTGLRSGTHYFAVTTVTSTGTESAFSQVGTKTIN